MVKLLCVPCPSISEAAAAAAASSRTSRTMCIVYYARQPVCDCVYVSGTIVLCSLFTGLAENRKRTAFSPKLLTGHCQDLDLFFNGVDYMSVDMKHYDIVPNGLDCPELETCEATGETGRCPLCDSRGVLKFLKAKGIEYTSVRVKAAHDLRDRAAEGGAEDAGKSVERSVGESADRPVGSSREKGRVVDKANRVRKMVERGRKALEGKRARTGLAESTLASMGWD